MQYYMFSISIIHNLRAINVKIFDKKAYINQFSSYIYKYIKRL